MTSIRIGHLSTGYHTALSAIGLRALEAAGHEADWRLSGTGPPIVKALEEGRLDIGYIGLPPAVIGIARGARIKCVAGGHMDGTVIIAHEEYKSSAEAGSEKEALAQFIGKKVGSPTKGSIHDVILRHTLSKHGLAEEVEVVNFPWTDLVGQAMEDRKVEAAVGTPSLQVSLSLVSGLKIKSLVPPDMLWPDNPSYGIIAAQSFMENHPEVLLYFLKIHESLTGFIKRKPAEAAGVSSKVVGVVGPEFFEECYRVSPRYCASLPGEYIDSTMRFVDALLDNGYISRRVGREEIFDTSFIERAHPEGSHYGQPFGATEYSFPWEG